MKWRCEWCHKPHESDDPPCDSCGHGRFERAIVPEYETVDTGTTYVWACPNCGREHVKNTPPCSRCGEPALEKVEQRYEDVERDLDVPSYLEVAKPYLPIVLAFAVVAALVATGVVSLSWLPGVGQPSAPDAPGESEVAAGIDLGDVEREVHVRLDRVRADAGEDRTYGDGLAALATYRNAQLVDAHYDDAPPDDPPDVESFDLSCSEPLVGAPLESFDASIEGYDDEGELAADIADALDGAFGETVRTGYDAEGLDVHVGPGPDRTVFVFYAAC